MPGGTGRLTCVSNGPRRLSPDRLANCQLADGPRDVPVADVRGRSEMFGDAVGMVLPHDIDAGGQREIEERLHEPQLLLIRHVIWSGEAISDVALDEKPLHLADAGAAIGEVEAFAFPLPDSGAPAFEVCGDFLAAEKLVEGHLLGRLAFFRARGQSVAS